jgi:predicted metal-dependent peptidase
MQTKKSTKTLDRVIGLRADMCWQIDTLAPALGALTFYEAQWCRTACVDMRGRCYVNPDFFAKLPDAEARFVLLHECLHPMLRHQERRGDRDPELFNIATDLSINAVLAQLKTPRDPNYVQVPKSALLPAKHLPEAPSFASAEEYYAWIMQHAGAKTAVLEVKAKAKLPGQDGEDDDSEGGDGDVMVGAGCGVKEDKTKDGKGRGQGQDGEEGDSDGDGDGGAGGGKGDKPAPGLSPTQWRLIGQIVREEARRAGQSAGNVALGALAGILDIPPPRVRWGDLLRKAATTALAEAGRDDVSWSRRSRRSNATYTIPGSVVTRAKIAVVIDASGSVSDDALARAVSETAAAVDATQVPAYLVIHDAAVHFAGWIRPGVSGRTVAGFVKGRGGTLFSPAYAAVAELRDKFGSLVHFTDGVPCEAWPELPPNCKRGIAALVGYADKSHVPETRWKAIPVDVK